MVIEGWNFLQLQAKVSVCETVKFHQCEFRVGSKETGLYIRWRGTFSGFEGVSIFFFFPSPRVSFCKARVLSKGPRSVRFSQSFEKRSHDWTRRERDWQVALYINGEAPGLVPRGRVSTARYFFTFFSGAFLSPARALGRVFKLFFSSFPAHALERTVLKLTNTGRMTNSGPAACPRRSRRFAASLRAVFRESKFESGL